MPEYDQQLLQENLRQAGKNLPGPDYYTVLEWVHRAHKPANYLEIGVRHGESIKRALPNTVCIGVDPLPQCGEGMPLRTSIFAITSDEFFASQDVRALLGGRQLDLAFIDGLHLWEQALKDFINIEPLLGPSSLVLLHDSIPLDAPTSNRERTTAFYSGDVWKLVACIRGEVPSLDMATVPTAPTGLTLVAGFGRGESRLDERIETLLAKYGPLGYDDYSAHPEWMPERIANSEDSVAGWINAHR